MASAPPDVLLVLTSGGLRAQHARHLLTLNLHLAAAHLAQQMRECGPAALMTEGHVEREMHAFKAPLRDRRAVNLEAIGARRACDQAALIRQRGAHPGLGPPARGRRSMDGPDYDAGGGAGGTRLLHKGVALPADEAEQALGQALGCVRARQWRFSVPQKELWLAVLQGWRRAGWGPGLQHVRRFSAAMRRGVREVHSTRHERASGKVSKYVTVRHVPATGPMPQEPQVLLAEVLHYLLLRCPGGARGAGEPPLEPLRLAVCRVHERRPLEEGMHVAEPGGRRFEVAFAVDQLGPLVATARDDGGRLYGLPYPCLGGLG